MQIYMHGNIIWRIAIKTHVLCHAKMEVFSRVLRSLSKCAHFSFPEPLFWIFMNLDECFTLYWYACMGVFFFKYGNQKWLVASLHGDINLLVQPSRVIQVRFSLPVVIGSLMQSVSTLQHFWIKNDGYARNWAHPTFALIYLLIWNQFKTKFQFWLFKR